MYTALTLLVLVGFAGFAVDLGNWYLRASRLQNSADASALGGVVFLPTDLGEARNIATKMAVGDGYATGDVAVTIGDRPNQLRVTVTDRVENYFLKVFGFDSFAMSRTALAEFEAPVPMGSPEAYLGNDPERGHEPDLWLNVGSLRNYPENGDRYHNGQCGPNAPCNPGAPRNSEYSSHGYFMAIEVHAPQAGKDLVFEVFDPAFYEVGDVCTDDGVTRWGDQPALAANANALRAAVAARPEVPPDWYADAEQRYARGNTKWCTGDYSAGATATGDPVTTTYLVREPDETPWLDHDNPVIASCQPQFKGYGRTWMRAQSIWQRLTPTADPANQEWRVDFPTGHWRQTFANTFRRWVTVCRVPAAQVRTGSYLLQVRTNAPLGSPQTASNAMSTWGHNRYAVRAGFASGSGAPDPAGVQVYANGRLPIYVNAESAATNFYLARVRPGSVARVLNLTLWDISDGGSSGEMRIRPPADAELGGSPMSKFSGCTFSKSAGGWTTDAGTCTIRFNASQLNAARVTISIPIPADYSCDEGSVDGCWVTVAAPFNGPVNDTTTWSADIVGDPVRLIE